MATFEKILLVGTQAAYDALPAKDENKLYFCSDTRMLYKGASCFSEAIRTVTTRPTTPAAGVVYFVTGTKTLDVWTGSAWEVIRLKTVTTISAASTDDETPTAKAVYDYITQALEDVTGAGDIVQNVEVSTVEGAMKVTRGGAASDVKVHGVVTTPSYDPATRKITLPVSDGEAVVIELGKDIFVDTSKDNKYNPDTKNIELWLNDGTKIEIPASGLVDVYTGKATATATVTVGSDNKIAVDVKLSNAEGNALTSDANGLFLSLAEYAKTTEVEGLVDAVEQKVDTNTGNIATNTAAIEKLNGDDATVGSVANKVKALENTLTPKITAAQNAADAAQADADTNAANITALGGRVTNLENAFGWGTF